MRPGHKISIAMTTYNGERFLPEQLDSFLWQTRLPDELVVCDDGSRDGTLTILQKYAEQAPFPIRIYRNPQNLGFSKNFEKAIAHCSMEIITLSDQDDVWLPEKLATIEQVFGEHPQIGAIFHDAYTVDENLVDLGHNLWKFHHLPNIKKTYGPSEFTKTLINKRFLHGFALSFRSNLCELILPFPPSWNHDHWVPFIASLFSSILLLHVKLVKYRQHLSQYSGARPTNIITKMHNNINAKRVYYKNELNRWNNAIFFLSSLNQKNNNEIISFLKDKICHYETRAQESYMSRLPLIWRDLLLGRYHRHSSGWMSFLKDLLF